MSGQNSPPGQAAVLAQTHSVLALTCAPGAANTSHKHPAILSSHQYWQMTSMETVHYNTHEGPQIIRPT